MSLDILGLYKSFQLISYYHMNEVKKGIYSWHILKIYLIEVRVLMFKIWIQHIEVLPEWQNQISNPVKRDSI